MDEPDIRLAGLSIWVRGWDREDWLRVRAEFDAGNAWVSAQGPILRGADLARFHEGVTAVDAGLADSATLASAEPNLLVSLIRQGSLGHFEMVVDITPDHTAQSHRFHVDIDQSYLVALLRQCRAVLARKPAG
ncbi:MAG: hypothetical protein ACFCVH_06995 [Alphaproteobacteria bacterium]